MPIPLEAILWGGLVVILSAILAVVHALDVVEVERAGDAGRARLLRALSVVAAALLHGAYDYIASTQTSSYAFLLFVALLFAVSYVLVGRMSKYDQYI